jgi:WD40 repeat protein
MEMRTQDPGDDVRYSVAPPKPRFKYSVPIRTAAVSFDGRILVALDLEGLINGWDIRTARLLYRRPVLKANDVPQRLTCSADGRFIALSPRFLPASILRVLRLETGEEVRRFDRGFSPAFSPDGEILVATAGRNLRRWALKSGAELPGLGESGVDLKWAAYSATGDHVAVSSENSNDVTVWDGATRRRVLSAGGGLGAAASLVFSPDGKTLVVGTLWGLKFYDLADAVHQELKGHEEYALGQLRFSRNGRHLIASIRQRRLLVWDIFSGQSLHTWGAFLMPDGLLEVSEAGDIAIWIERGGIRLERIPLVLGGEAEGHFVRNIGFTAEGHAITGDDKGMVRIWNPSTQEEFRRFEVPLRQLRFFSLDGKWAVFGGGKDPVHVWDLSAGRELLKAEVVPYVNVVALSPDRSSLALGHSDGAVSLWDIPENRERTRVRLEIAGVTAICWSSDGKSLAWGDATGAVVIAEGKRGGEPLHFQPRGDAAILDLVFSPDGKSLLAYDKRGVRRSYRDEAGSEPVIVKPAPQESALDDRWNASGFLQKRWMLGIAREVISPDRTFVLTATTWGTALIWQAPGEK